MLIEFQAHAVLTSFRVCLKRRSRRSRYRELVICVHVAHMVDERLERTRDVRATLLGTAMLREHLLDSRLLLLPFSAKLSPELWVLLGQAGCEGIGNVIAIGQGGKTWHLKTNPRCRPNQDLVSVNMSKLEP